MRRLLKQNCWSQRVGSVAEDATQRRGPRCSNHSGMAEPGEGETLELGKRNARVFCGLPGADRFGFQSDGNDHDGGRSAVQKCNKRRRKKFPFECILLLHAEASLVFFGCALASPWHRERG